MIQPPLPNSHYPQRREKLRTIFLSTLGVFLAVNTIACLSAAFSLNFLLPPLGASAFIAFVAPQSVFARPKNMIIGHLLAVLSGLFFSVFPFHWWISGLAVGSAVALMQLFRVMHPPAAANPLLVLLEPVTAPDIVAAIFFSTLLLVFVAMVFHQYIRRHRLFRLPLFYFLRSCVALDKRMSQLRLPHA